MDQVTTRGAAGDMNEPAIPWQEIAAMLWRRRALIAVVFATGLLTVIVLAWLKAPAYRAAARIMVIPARATITVSPDANEGSRVAPLDMDSEVALLSSKELLREVLEPYRGRPDEEQPTGIVHTVLSALRYPFGLPGRIYRWIHDLPPISGFEYWVDTVANQLSVTPIGRSSLIEVAYEDAQPAWAAEMVNSVVSRHVEHHIRMNQQSGAQQFYEQQRELLADKLRQAEAALRDFSDREGTMNDSLASLRKRVAGIQSSMAETEAKLAENNAKAEFLSRAASVLPKGASDGASPSRGLGGDLVRARILELELQRSQLLAQYAPTSMKVSDIERQLAEAKRLLGEQGQSGASAIGDTGRMALEIDLTKARAQTAALEARAQTLRAQLDGYQTQLEHLDAIGSEQERLEQEVTTAKQSLLTYLKKEEEARFSSALDESRIVNVRIVDRAVVPETPEPSKRTMTIVLGAAMSLAAALGLAFVRDRLDPSVKSSSEARRVSGLPILAEIPS